MKVSIRNINIPPSYAISLPKTRRVNTAVKYYQQHGKFDKPIIVDNYTDLFLVDGLIRYLAALKLGLSYVDVFTITDNLTNNNEPITTTLKPTLYIQGVFEKGGKLYVWKVPDKFYLKKGDKVLVETIDPETNEPTTATVTVVSIMYQFYVENHHKSVIDIVELDEDSNNE